MTLALALLLGLVVGMVMGGLGGGGAILTVPLLVYGFGLDAQGATTASLVIVGVSAAVAAISRARVGHVDWRTGLTFGMTGLPAAWLGTGVNRRIDGTALLAGLAAVMAVAGIIMLLRGHLAYDSPPAAPAGRERARRTALVLAAGVAVGFLTGLFGAGGGFVIVPTLTLVLATVMPVAVGTSLMIISINSALSLVAHGVQDVDWSLVVPLTAASVVGTLFGQRIATRLPQTMLQRVFGVLLLLVAAYTGVRSVLTFA